jgi:hypothetical protein
MTEVYNKPDALYDHATHPLFISLFAVMSS